MATTSPPGSPVPGFQVPQRPLSAMVRPSPRSNSRMSMASKAGGGSRASDEDGRTAVKVAVRVRPPLNSTDPGFDLIPQRFQRSMVQLQSDTSLAIDAPQGKKLFVFDRVFGPEVDQEGVWEYLNECVGAFLQGYNVSLLAYGQSGAGKSFTMGTSGPLDQDDLENMGVVPRAATALFEKLEGPARPSNNPNRGSMSQLRAPRYSVSSAPSLGLPKTEKNWVLKATYVEIYNEQLRDLLIPEHVPASERGTVTVREDVRGNIILTGLRQVEINSVDELMNALNQGSTLRQTDATAINARSSRSHAVFSLNLVQRKLKSQATATPGADKRLSMPLEAMTGGETWVTTDSKLHFVDLAGSERLKNTHAEGTRAKEGISINGGLAALGKVISQLSSRQPGAHVSYRDSKLTRLLQDSLGGNAITYMIACVTPAEFHLSETLNTVQYAQRARAIQSKPQIQAVEEGDKQGIIDRLKAEVAFLRDQIRSAERGGGERSERQNERSERHNERENELQNQLLDVQENYTTLSQRHAKLIVEMAKARDSEAAENQLHDEALGENATERINRSNSFAQAVEQVVLEYEKTIQSLEQSLSSTRSTLANTETSLLEKETKCAYAETINTQLQARLQKLIDREASTETYLHDLESKLSGHTSGDEKNAAVVVELRKEIARSRENESNCEDYISTLEERLAESDQDTELMQREIDRLEQVIERQRSLGKLDSLLYELDTIQQDSKGREPEPDFNGNAAATGHRRAHSRSFAEHSRSQSHVSRQSHMEAAILEEVAEEPAIRSTPGTPAQDEFSNATPPDVAAAAAADHSEPRAQSRAVAERLETVTQELVDLRVDHDGMLGEYEMLHAKYEQALRTLAELQDAVDEARHPTNKRDSMLSVTSPTQTRPPSFLSDARSSETKDGTRFSSRSLSSELSSAMESPATMLEVSDTETAVPKAVAAHSPAAPEDVDVANELAMEVQRLRAMAAAKDEAEHELIVRYAQLEDRHSETLDMVEELKTEVAKAQAANFEASSPKTNGPVIRRKSSNNVMIIDRAHRSFASLRNIAADNFESQPDVMQNFELNINAAMHELHARSERIQELEADVATTKKELENKMTLISGLTRERSSMKTSPMDMAVVSSLREQLEKNGQQLQHMQENHRAREKELEGQLEGLRQSLAQASTSASGQNRETAQPTHDDAREQRIADLEVELASWESKHQTALEVMRGTEERMKKTIEELESQVVALDSRQAAREGSASEGGEGDQEIVAVLRGEIEEYKAALSSNAEKVADFEANHAATRSLLDTTTQERDLALEQREAVTAEVHAHQQLLEQLDTQLAEHESAIKKHAIAIQELEESHAREVDDIEASCKQEYDSQLTTLMVEHAENIRILESDLTEAREDLMKVATNVAFALGLDVSVEKISERIQILIKNNEALELEQHKVAELEQHVVELSGISDTVMQDLEIVKSALADVLTEKGERTMSPMPIRDQVALLRKRMADLETKNKKHSQLVEELEDQLQSNFDQAQLTSNRLSTLKTEANAQLEEANAAKFRLQAELEAIKEEYTALQARVDGPDAPQRSNSMTSNLRKSGSVASLPSPPPAIPLPPLPGGQGAPTHPGSPTPRPPSKDASGSAGSLTQLQEDQEARIRLIEKHLSAEKQLTATLEEALTDLEEQQKKIKADCDAWRRRAGELETEMEELRRRPPPDNRFSLQQVEEERRKRQAAEAARAHLEERMNTIAKKKKKGSLNCF